MKPILRSTPSTACLALLLMAAAQAFGAETLRLNDLSAPLSQPVDIEISVLPAEVQVHAQQKNLAGWWFLGGIIGLAYASDSNSNNSRKASRAQDELMEILNTVDCQSILSQRYEGGLNPGILPVLGTVSYTKPGGQASTAEGSGDGSAEHLSVQYSCGLLDNFSSIQVTMKAVLWKTPSHAQMDTMADGQLREQAKYFQVFSYEITPEEMPATKDEVKRANAWVAMGKDNLSARILVGMTSLADALAYDLGCLDLAAEAHVKAAGPGASGDPSAHLILDDGKRKWIRSDDGEITILDMN